MKPSYLDRLPHPSSRAHWLAVEFGQAGNRRDPGEQAHSLLPRGPLGAPGAAAARDSRSLLLSTWPASPTAAFFHVSAALRLLGPCAIELALPSRHVHTQPAFSTRKEGGGKKVKKFREGRKNNTVFIALEWVASPVSRGASQPRD